MTNEETNRIALQLTDPQHPELDQFLVPIEPATELNLKPTSNRFRKLNLVRNDLASIPWRIISENPTHVLIHPTGSQAQDNSEFAEILQSHGLNLIMVSMALSNRLPERDYVSDHPDWLRTLALTLQATIQQLTEES